MLWTTILFEVGVKWLDEVVVKVRGFELWISDEACALRENVGSVVPCVKDLLNDEEASRSEEARSMCFYEVLGLLERTKGGCVIKWVEGASHSDEEIVWLSFWACLHRQD